MRFTISYKWYRLMGMTGLFLVGYIVVIGIFGKVDISPYLPMKLATTIIHEWPTLPFFTTRIESIDPGGKQVIYYTVPTRQLTKQEIAQMIGTNHVAHPAPPTSPVPAAR